LGDRVRRGLTARPETHLTYMINICLSMAMLDACGGPDGNTRFRSG
jgi:hypothetical protein